MKQIIFIIFIIYFLTSCIKTEKQYYEDGNLKCSIQIKNGEKHGKYLKYFQNGNLSEKSTFINDKREGIAIGYFENGDIKFEGIYKNGQKNGIFKIYYEGGKIRSIEEFKDNIPNGKYLYYFNNGKLAMEALIKNNVEYYYRKYDTISNIIDELRTVLFISKEDSIGFKNSINKLKFQPDTIQLKDSISLKIMLSGPIDYKKTEFGINLIEPNDSQVKAIDYIPSLKPDKEFQFVPNKIGKYILSVVIGVNDSVWYSGYNEYFIKPTPRFSASDNEDAIE
ncbi:MAG: toxin-antitoxin system YwqK family antitoxin [Bacteroidales bacterium]|nr:toxin-antitoxin system YwqK family antitoxin [Bacteroidales bacterium]